MSEEDGQAGDGDHGGENDQNSPEAEGSPAEQTTDCEGVSFDLLETRLDDLEAEIDATETEATLDEVESSLADLENDIEQAAFQDTTEDEDDHKAELTDRVADLSESIEKKRGPYVEEVAEELQATADTIRSKELTEEGLEAVGTAVDECLETVESSLERSVSRHSDTAAGIAEELTEVAGRIESSGLDPDDDEEQIEQLLTVVGTLRSTTDEARVFEDLEIREQLRRQGFYDVLEPINMRDFPPEWNAIKIYEKRGEPEPILDAMGKFDSDFMEDNILDSLEHFAPPEAFEQVHQLAQRRNRQPVRILGRIGDERACDTLVDFLGGGSIELEKTALQALGSIGSEDTTEPVAQRLVADEASVRSTTARTLGLIGDTRAIEPLGDVLAEDESDNVRASAAWALVQIGTKRALKLAADYEDDAAYIVQTEAKKAVEALPQAVPR